jgi:CRISPR/Cas system-associated endoribonuclease Cas2
MNTDGTGFYICKECHQTESLRNHITTDHKEEEQLENRKNVGENSCNSGDGTDQRVQSSMFMMMMNKKKMKKFKSKLRNKC